LRLESIMSQSPVEVYYPGLEGVIAAETAIANIEGKEGSGGLEYRGYRIEDLAGAVSYEEAAYLLLHGDLPTPTQLAEFKARLVQSRSLPDPVLTLLKSLPPQTNTMDVLRTAVSVLSHFDPEINAPVTDHAANVRKAERLIAQMPLVIAGFERISHGQEVLPSRDDLDLSANFLYAVSGRVPSKEMVAAFDLSLVLYAEHELNASTFAARVTVSTLSDLHSGIIAAIGTLKGNLHGGANEEAWKVLEAVDSPDHAKQWVHDALARKERIMGFGHRVYKNGDPRAAILTKHCQVLAEQTGNQHWESIAHTIESVVVDQKKLPPNVDWPSARLYHYLGLRIETYTPIFAMARTAGWSAHIIEQLDHNRLMRPRARYIGPPNRPVTPLNQRG